MGYLVGGIAFRSLSLDSLHPAGALGGGGGEVEAQAEEVEVEEEEEKEEEEDESLERHSIQINGR